MNRTTLVAALSWSSVVVYLVALPWNAFCAVYGTTRCYAGGEVALSGLVGLLTLEPGNLCWLANPLALLALLTIAVKPRWHRTILVLGCGALALALAFLAFGHVTDVPLVTDNPSEGEHMPLTAIGPAYWLWVAAIALVCTAAIVQARRPSEH